MMQLGNTYTEQLSEHFYELRQPETQPNAELILFNEELAAFLGLEHKLDVDSLTAIYSGTTIPEHLTPIAMAYAGHQFGNFVPQLGDGRAVMLGDITASNELRYDIQLKGSGQTRFSRAGDGKSALGPVIREYVVSEAMFNLGIPTTRALAAVNTGETVYRQQPEPGGVFTRVARGHVRIGTFEFFAARQMNDEIKQLADYCIERLYPEAKHYSNPYLAFFDLVSQNIMSLVAKWQGVGFIHGVMNTDNMSIAAETIDYGPCAFMDEFRADKVFSSIDQHGRYAFNQQPAIAQWNLSILASCLVPLIHDDEAQAIELLNEKMRALQEYFEAQWLTVFRAKFGLFNEEPEDKALIENFLNHMQVQRQDYTIGFRELLTDRSEQHAQRLERQEQSLEEAVALMTQSNPFIIPRNHQVEQAIQDANRGDFAHFKRLVSAYQKPYESNAENMDLTLPPKASEVVTQTFCGT